jgi:hypothetical protein
MNLEEFKKEYCKSEVNLQNVTIKIDKIPAFTGERLFMSLFKKIFGDIKDIEMSDNKFQANILMNAISGLDIDYLENEVEPILYSHISFKTSPNGNYPKYINLWGDSGSGKRLIEPFLEFDEVFEILLRGICVNFLPSLHKRFQKLIGSKKLNLAQ